MIVKLVLVKLVNFMKEEFNYHVDKTATKDASSSQSS